MTAQLRALTRTPPRAAIYLRQSTYREESISLELQETACRDYCDRMGYDVVAVKDDPGISGRTWKRRGVQETMSLIEGGDADVIVLWKWSRLSRNRKDWALAIDKVDIAGGRIEAATEPIDVATASGRFARGVMTEYAAFQSEQIGETWEAVRQRRLNRGLPASGRLPFGWRWIKGEGIESDPERAPYVAEMYRRYLSGDGSATIARWLNQEGVPAPNGGTWARTRPLTVMDSPIHAGLIPYRGSTYPGAHAPIIDSETWNAYQAERASRATSSVKPREYDHLLSLLMHCACGGRMHGKGAYTGGKWYGGYICGATLNGHPQRAYVSALNVDPAVSQWLMQYDPEVDATADQTVARARLDTVHRAINKLEDELARGARQVMEQILPEQAYLRNRKVYEAEIATLTAEARLLSGASKSIPSRDELQTLRDAWDFMVISERNKALRDVIDRIDMLADGRTARITTPWGDSSVVTW